MKKQLFFLAAAALALASCSSENDVVQTPNVVEQTVDDGVVVFDAYQSRGLTRGGQTGVINSTDDLKAKYGFGVFGYYTNSERYSGITKPNFFYNQKVYWGGSVWTYDPIKYWPNEFGNDAISDQVDRVTFFAYAPWVDVDPLTGVVKPAPDGASDEQKQAADPNNNIISMTRNNVTGDPYIRYSASMDPANCTDLLYGVAAEEFTSSNSFVNINKIPKGSPYKDVVKPGTDAKSKIFFDFKHALAQLKVTINADVKDLTNNITDIQTTKTRIWVRSITFEGIAQEGSLNLNSTAPDPLWYDINGINKITTGKLTVYDGRKDDREAMEEAPTETPATFNPDIVQSKKYTINNSGNITNTIMGVTATEKNLFNGDYVFAIPTGEKMKVTIVYDVETYDPNLAFYLSDGETLGSTVENKITKTIDAFGAIKAGYCYNLKLHLGMRTVDFDAMVTPWQNYGADVDLPSNIQTFAAGTSPYPEITIPSNLSTYSFAVSGLTPNATISTKSATIGGVGCTIDCTPVNGSGISIATVSGIVENKTVDKKDGTFTVSDGTNSVTINVKQAPHALELAVQSVSGATLSLTKSATLTSIWSACIPDASSKEQIQVWRNGQVINVSGSNPTAANEAKFAGGGLTFASNLNPGDVVTVWIKAKDAAEESVTVNIGGPMLSNADEPLEYGETYTRLPDFYGPAAHGYTWTSSNNDIATVASGVVTSVKEGSVTITLATDAIAPADGWVYETSNRTYVVNVNKATAKISFTTPAPGTLSGTKNKTEGTIIIENIALLKNSKGTELLKDAAKGGTVNYAVTGVIKGEAPGDLADFDVTTTPGTLIIASGKTLDSGTTYTVTVTATVNATSAQATYTQSSITYSVTFTTGS